MMVNSFRKLISVVVVICVVSLLPTPLYAGKYFIDASGSEKGQEMSVGYKFKFGPQEAVKQDPYRMQELMQENTSGITGMVGLIILGACIVVAAVLIVNKADDVTEAAEEVVEEVQEDIDTKYEETQTEIEETRDELETTKDEYEETTA